MGEESGGYCGGSGYTRGLCVATQMSQCNLKGEMGSPPTPGPLGMRWEGSHDVSLGNRWKSSFLVGGDPRGWIYNLHHLSQG